MKNNKSRRQARIEIIEVLYKFELLDRQIDVSQIFDEYPHLNKEQLKKLELIAKNYKFLVKTISSLLNKDWSWKRISPLLRAILLNGAFELYSVDPKIVINESIEITKIYFPKPGVDETPTNDSKFYRFVNALLENYFKLIKTLDVINERTNNEKQD
ncbi:transcription antitermination protein NusB [Mycoplasma sp. Pen4]|uniref:transcription antitermination protein NusB n=1 Tax=Mycoplasma sp. Pen4 TaxID=640330 RepID=UPI001654BC66|nr:transcription antitermination protein NusB [Mycoplasma sp. Pen4]QNM93904.1 transcription antitermination protein NusB [Mycoplasma sp. Pen4]